MDVHRVTVDELEAAADTIALAFRTDPVWKIALAGLGEDRLSRFWRFYV